MISKDSNDDYDVISEQRYPFAKGLAVAGGMFLAIIEDWEVNYQNLDLDESLDILTESLISQAREFQKGMEDEVFEFIRFCPRKGNKDLV